ncbi:MAG: tetratricopeptide repeat protein [Planctomycetes bacterium]|nr:tetratricopeptide repeat protein [Planctomycetota bacterium]
MTPSCAPAASRLQAWTVPALIVLAIWGTYAVALQGELVFDDHFIVERNPLIKPGTTLGRIFSSPYFRGQGYRPLTVLSFAVDYRLYGLAPTGYHVTNVLLHTVNALLVLLLARKLFGPCLLADATALLFALHPVHAEPVAGIAQRDALLSAGFYLLGWLLYLRGDRPGLAGALLAYGLGLLAKEDAATLPVVLFLGDLAFPGEPRRRSLRGSVVACAAFALPLAPCLALRYQALGALGAGGDRAYFTDCPFVVVVLTMGRFFAEHCLPGLLLGVRISCDYQRPAFADAGPREVVAWLETAGLATAVVAAGWLALRRRSVAAFGVLFAFVAYLPVSNLLVPIWALGAQRYLYLPSLGACVSLAAACTAFRGGPAPLARPFLGGVLALFALLAVQEAALWRHGATLYAAMLERTPDNPTPHINLGLVAYRSGDLRKAVPLLERAAALAPEAVLPVVNLAAVYGDQGRCDEALALLRRVQGKGRNNRELPWIATAHFLRLRGETAEARAAIAEAFKEAPESAEAWQRLAEIAADEGKFEEAETDFRRCLSIDPDRAIAALNLGGLLRHMRRHAEAIGRLRSAVASEPGLTAAWGLLAVTLEETGDLVGAEQAYRGAVASAGASAALRQGLGALLLKAGRPREAEGELRTALRLDPALLEARLQLGVALARQGDPAHAVAEWEEFVRAAGDAARYAKGVEWVRQQLEHAREKK